MTEDPSAPWPPDVVLTGQSVRLEPLAREHCPALAEAVQDGELWRLWYTTVPTPDGMMAEIERRLALRKAGSMAPFAVINLSTGAPEIGRAHV